MMLSLATPVALAGNLRIYALGDQSWIIDDDTDNFNNPANSAWVEEGYLDFEGALNTAAYANTNKDSSLIGRLYFIKPLGMLAGYQNVLGGWGVLRQNLSDVNKYDDKYSYGPYVYDKTFSVLNLQDALRSNDRFAIGGSFTYFPNPASRKYRYDSGKLSEYKDKGSSIDLEGAVTYRATDHTQLEFGMINSSQGSSVDKYVDSKYSYSYKYDYSENIMHGKASYAFSDQAKVAVVVEGSNWSENDAGSKSNGTSRVVTIGSTYKPGDRLLLAGSADMGTDVSSSNTKGSTYTDLRGGVEYQLTEYLALRGGIVQTLNSSTNYSRLHFTAGAGLALGPGQLDLYALAGTSSSDTKFNALQAGYKIKF